MAQSLAATGDRPPRASYQKKYLSELTRNSVVAGRMSTRHTDAYSGPGTLNLRSRK